MKKSQQSKQRRRIGVFGLGRFGSGLAVRLAELGADVLAVDADPPKVEQIDQRVSRALCLDFTNEFAMKKVEVGTLDLAIVCVGRNIQSGLLATAVLQKLGAKNIWVRAIDQSQAEILEAMGVAKILSLEKEMALQVAQNVMMPVTQVIMPIAGNHHLAEIKAKPEFAGKTLGELNFRNVYRVNVVAIQSRQSIRNGNGSEKVETIVNDLPDADDVIREGDVLVVIGTDEEVMALQADY